MTTTATAWQNRITGYGTEAPDQLAANPKNWRVHPKQQQAALKGSLDELGWIQNVIVNQRTGFVVDGHARVALALRHEQAEVPVTYVDLSEAEEALALATLDPISAMAGADKDQLEALLADIQTQDAGLTEMLAGLGEQHDIAAAASGLTDPDDVPDPPAEPITKPGDLWLLGEHRLLCGDATDEQDLTRLMGGSVARLVVTSPPYNQDIQTFKPSGMQRESPAFVRRMASAYADSKPEDEYQDEQIAMLQSLPSFMTADGSIFYNHKIRYRDKRIVSPLEWLSRLPFPVRQEIIWDRSSSMTLNARMFVPADERIYWLRVGDDFLFHDTTAIKSWTTVWRIAAQNDVEVTAPFATEIPRRCIAATSEPDDIVLEPYAGSGTTLIAAEQLGRRCYGMEIDPTYCDVIVTRWEQFTGNTASRERIEDAA